MDDINNTKGRTKHGTNLISKNFKGETIMKKVILAVMVAATLSGNVFAGTPVTDKLTETTFRTGTCGGTKDAQGTCVSMGIDMETGKVYKSISTNDSNLWNGKNVEKIGQFATVDTIGKEVTDALDDRLTVVEKKDSVIVNRYEGDTVHNIDTVQGGATITDSTVTIGNVSGSVHNSCGASVANGSTVNCESNYILNADGLTDEQLANLKGETGATGADGKDGLDGNTTRQSVISSENPDSGVKTLGSYTTVNGSDEHGGAIDSSVYSTMTSNGVSTTKVTSSEVKQCTEDSDHSWCKQGSDSYVELTTETLRVDLVTEQELDEVQEIVRDNSIDIVNLENSKVDKGDYEADQERQDKALSDAVDSQEVKDSAQDSTIASNTTDISETNVRIDNEVLRLEDEIELGDAKTLEAANTYTDVKVAHETAQREAADQLIVQEQAKVDAIQDAKSVAYRVKNDERVSLVEQELYSTTARSVDNSKRLDKVETEIAGIHNDIKVLEKGIAMSAALGFGSNLHTKNHNGNWTLTPSIASYESNIALAITAQVSVTDDMSIRVGYSNVGSELLEIDKGILGGAITFSFD